MRQDSMPSRIHRPRLYWCAAIWERTKITTKMDADATGDGYDSTSSTRSGPTPTRPRTVAASVVTGPEKPSQSRGERYASGHFESGCPMGADDVDIISF